MLVKQSILLLLLLLPVASARSVVSLGETPLLVIEVNSKNFDYQDPIASLALPNHIHLRQPFTLIDMDNKKAIPFQISMDSAQSTHKLWFIVKDRLPSNTVRRYALYHGNPVVNRSLSLEFDEAVVRLKKNGHPILQYNQAHVTPPAGIKSVFSRSGYIHPVYSPDGLQVTEDFPDNHRHHKGVWLPWTQTEYKGQVIDFWNLDKEEGTVQFSGFNTMYSGSVFVGFSANHEHVRFAGNHAEPVLLETWDVRAWNTGEAYHMWDLHSYQFTASDSSLKLLKYRYGGLGFRGSRYWSDDNHIILTSEGHTKENGNGQRARWVAQSGEIVTGQSATVVIMSHPENYSHPEPIRIWESGGSFFNYAPVQLGERVLKPGKTYPFRYRFIVHDGDIDPDLAERMWQQYAHPVTTRIVHD